MIAWGYWILPYGTEYAIIARCGSSCDHMMYRLVSIYDIYYLNFDIFKYLYKEFEEAFDHAHDSIPQNLGRA